VRTGDIGRLDIDGYLTLSGRIKELIKVSGYSVFPEDVESILIMHPGVEQVGRHWCRRPQEGASGCGICGPKAGQYTEYRRAHSLEPRKYVGL